MSYTDQVLQMLLMGAQPMVQAEAGRLAQMQAAPINRQFVNPGQGAREALLNPDQNQNRALLDAGLTMLARDPTQMPGATVAQAIRGGMSTLDESRMQDRTLGIEAQGTRLQAAMDQRDTPINMMRATTGLIGPGGFVAGESFQVADKDGNIYAGKQVIDRRTGRPSVAWSPLTEGSPPEPQGPVERLGGSGLTSQQRVDEAAASRLQTQQIDTSVALGRDAFEQMAPVASSISMYDQAIAEIDSGAETGPIYSRLPSFSEASVRLDNIQGQLGINVINMATFGALSEKELALALDTALPTNLPPQKLREWLVAKRDAHRKLYNELRNAATFMSRGGTLADYLEGMQQAGRLKYADESLPLVNKQGWRLVKDANGNQAYQNPQNPDEFEEIQ